MMNIYKVKILFNDVGKAIDNYVASNYCEEKFKNELLNLSTQCSQSAFKIVRDHADEELALENCQLILRQFNKLVLEYEKATYLGY